MTYDQLQAMPYDSLRELYSKICDVLKTKRELKAKEVSRTIEVGMIVEFKGRKSSSDKPNNCKLHTYKYRTKLETTIIGSFCNQLKKIQK